MSGKMLARRFSTVEKLRDSTTTSVQQSTKNLSPSPIRPILSMRSKTMKVLIVEDDLTTGHLMKYVVGRHADFTHAIDGEEAFDAFCDAFEAGEPFDLVFLDLMLPIVDGQEVLQAIRQFEEQNGIIHTEGVPVVVTTALEDNSEVHQAMAAGALDYLMKPVKTEKLLEIIKRVERHITATESLEETTLCNMTGGGNPSKLQAKEACDEY